MPFISHNQWHEVYKFDSTLTHGQHVVARFIKVERPELFEQGRWAGKGIKILNGTLDMRPHGAYICSLD